MPNKLGVRMSHYTHQDRKTQVRIASRCAVWKPCVTVLNASCAKLVLLKFSTEGVKEEQDHIYHITLS